MPFLNLFAVLEDKFGVRELYDYQCMQDIIDMVPLLFIGYKVVAVAVPANQARKLIHATTAEARINRAIFDAMPEYGSIDTTDLKRMLKNIRQELGFIRRGYEFETALKNKEQEFQKEWGISLQKLMKEPTYL